MFIIHFGFLPFFSVWTEVLSKTFLLPERSMRTTFQSHNWFPRSLFHLECAVESNLYAELPPLQPEVCIKERCWIKIGVDVRRIRWYD